MDLETEEQKRESFRNILFELASSQDNFEENTEIYDKFKTLYDRDNNEKFRHFYSDIFPVLRKIKDSSDYGDLDILSQNLDIVRCKYQERNRDENGALTDICNSLNKLYDHINLEISRINYFEGLFSQKIGKGELNNINASIRTLTNTSERLSNDFDQKIKKAEKRIETIQEKTENQQKEYITILSILSSVILVFNAGIIFSASVLENISASTIYRIVLIALIIGLVIINLIFALFYYLNQILEKNTSLKPLIFSNVLFIFLIACTVLGWCFGVVEDRNDRIPPDPPYIETNLTQ